MSVESCKVQKFGSCDKVYAWCIVGLCVVDETEKGWFVQYIDRDPETLRKAEAAKSREKHEKDDEERLAAFIQVFELFSIICIVQNFVPEACHIGYRSYNMLIDQQNQSTNHRIILHCEKVFICRVDFLGYQIRLRC